MKKILTLLLALLLAFSLCGAAFAESSYIVDNEGLLTQEELNSLNNVAEIVSDTYQCSVNVLFTDSLDGKDAQSYAEDYYDQNNLGYHGTYDGILLVVSMAEREYYITSAGAAQDAVVGTRLDTLEDAFLRLLSSGRYYDAVYAFIQQCGVQLAHKDEPYEEPYDEPYEEPTPARMAAGGVGSLLLGFLLSMIPTGIMKSQTNNVRQQAAATSYVRDGSLDLQICRDTFLRATTDRVRIQTENRSGGSGGGGGSFHVSSGGVSHTGGGGKF